jgi:large subunit ribosomal protein L5
MQRDDRLASLPPAPAGAQVDQEQPAAERGRGGRRGGAAAAAPAAPGAREEQRQQQQQQPARGGRQAQTASPGAFPKGYVPRLKMQYAETVAPALMKEFGYTNVMQVPRMEKITLNIGAGEARENARTLEGIQQDLTTIAGQKPVVTRARKSIAAFKIREGNTIGASVTLRGDRMWHFLDRLISVALPRTRDFRGVPRGSFDGRGDYSLGLREQIIFPEIDYNRIDKIRGLQVTIVTSANTDDEGRRLLELLGMPFARQDGR